ncbi:MAG TPA: GNAT family N-acetyltransferase [Rhodanobacteraceae bacterium]|nr:GNAT family N-acetyltransferase [Rhodanobacteraceae bacterium]
MKLPPIDRRYGDCEDIETFLAERIYEFNSKTTGYFDGESFAATQKDESGTILAGISGFTWGGCCFVSYLWVAEEHRGKGLGRRLLTAFERNAIEKGCRIALLSSHSFQSPDFYARMGYEEQASIQDYPMGHTDIFFAKRLAPDTA